MGDMQGHDMVLWVWRMFVVGIMVAVLIWFNFITLRASYDTTKAESSLVLNSMLSSQDGVMMNIDGRVYPIVDINDLGRLKNGFFLNLSDGTPPDLDASIRQQYVAYNVSVLDEDNISLKNIIFNSKYYHRWRVIADSGIGGSMSVSRAKQHMPVMIKNGTIVKKGVLI